MEYQVATVKYSGEWNIVETFEAADNVDAEKYVEREYDEEEDTWFILCNGENIHL